MRIGPHGVRELLHALAGTGQAARAAARSVGMARLRGDITLPVGVPLVPAGDGNP